MVTPLPQPFQQVRFVTDAGNRRIAYVTSLGPRADMVNLFIFADVNDDQGDQAGNIPYELPGTGGNPDVAYSWHYITDES